MTKFTRLFLILIFFNLLSTSLVGQENRGFDRSQLQELREDPDYQYELIKPEPEGFFSRVWNRIVDWFWGLFQTEGSRSALDIVFKLFLASVFIYFLVKLFGGDVTSIFKPNKKPLDLQYDVDEEAIHEIDFEQELDQAKQAGNFRFIIRLYYLWALKNAADAEWVTLMQGKTNREYLYELSGKPIEQEFKGLSYLFDYTWYGHFDANAELAEKAKGLREKIFEQKGGTLGR